MWFSALSLLGINDSFHFYDWTHYINRIVYDEIKNHSGLVMYLALLEFNLRENVVMVFKLNMTVW